MSNVPKLIEEVGVTHKSLSNAKSLVAAFGVPLEVVITMDAEHAEYHTTAFWQEGFEWRFNGFSCGYRGEGCHGLLQFLRNMCGMSITIEEISSWQKAEISIFPRRNHYSMKRVS